MSVSLNILRYRMNNLNRFYIILLTLSTLGCDDFVDVDLPKDRLTSEAVFADVATATSALRSIYANMRSNSLTSRLSTRLGLYTDELDNYRIVGNDYYDHTIVPTNSDISALWSSAYNMIFAANAVLEGVENSATLSLEDKRQLRGEALFIRAYIHSLLVNIFGPIPYIVTKDFTENTSVSRMSTNNVYQDIIDDLLEASNLLEEDISGERVRAYGAVVDALLARVYLYTEQWQHAEERASKIIEDFEWESDLNEVFLKDASGTIWQFKPFPEGSNTEDATSFIFNGRPTNMALSSLLLDAFEPGDQRKVNWIGTTTSTSGGITETWYYPFKYKENGNTTSSLEYPIIFRLAEQYLIRAEALTQLGNNLSWAQSDLNVIRNRAGLPNNSAGSRDELFDAIFHERQVEFFTERGHRWFDLKRAGNAGAILAPLKLNWKETNILFPIPESEILLNPNLLPQNDGYN